MEQGGDTVSKIRVCIYDRDKEYVRRLATMISRCGEGKYKVSAFDNSEDLLAQIKKKSFHIFIGNSEELETELQEGNTSVIQLMENDKEDSVEMKRDRKKYYVSKYAGAKQIFQQVVMVAEEFESQEKNRNRLVAIYSPVGRCGKTQFALSLRKEGYGKKWLYISFEEYGVIGNIENDIQEYSWENSFLYYIKERNTQQVNQVIDKGNGIIMSSFSPIDGKQLTEDDFVWMIQTIREQKYYSGIVFDMGTGILQRLEWLDLFDDIVVPYIPNDMALRKKDKFTHILEASDLDYVMEKIIYLNMSKTEEIEQQRMQLINETGTRVSIGSKT